MPLSALPESLQDVENHFPDDDQYKNVPIFGNLYRWYQKKSKTWFAFSYRCTEWWAKWRKFPTVLFAIGGKGEWRFETHAETGYGIVSAELYTPNAVFFSLDSGNYYLSRIQYYKRWHFAIQWPLMVSFHVYKKEINVPIIGQTLPDLDGKLWFAYWNHFDADLVYWMLTSFFVGGGWK